MAAVVAESSPPDRRMTAGFGFMVLGGIWPCPKSCIMPQLFAEGKERASEPKFPRRPGDVRESVSRSGLHDRNRLPGVHVGLPEDGPARFRHAHVPLRARPEVRGAEEPEALSAAVPQRGHFLRARDEPHSRRPWSSLLRRGGWN